MTLEEAKAMSPNQINGVIAEAMGWRTCTAVKINGTWQSNQFYYDGNKEFDPANPPAGYSSFIHPPDYFHDLNACQKAVAMLEDNREKLAFCDSVLRILGSPHKQSEMTTQDWWKLMLVKCSDRAIALAVVLSERTL